MVDEIFDRAYREGREQLNGGLTAFARRFGREAGHALEVLHRIEWAAPWASASAARKRDGCR